MPIIQCDRNLLSLHLFVNTFRKITLFPLLTTFTVTCVGLWPTNVSIRFGEEEIKKLCNKFLLNQKKKTLKGFNILIHEGTSEIEELKDINNLIKTIPCSTTGCERGFSLMNIICTDLRSRFAIKNISNLMFININIPPLSIQKPEDYVKSRILNYRSADDNRSKM